MHTYYTFSRLDLTIKGPFSKVSNIFLFWQVDLKNLVKYHSFKFWHLFHQTKRVPCKPKRASFRRTCSFQTADVSQSPQSILSLCVLWKESYILSKRSLWKENCSTSALVSGSWIDRLVIALAKFILNHEPWYARCKNGQNAKNAGPIKPWAGSRLLDPWHLTDQTAGKKGQQQKWSISVLLHCNHSSSPIWWSRRRWWWWLCLQGSVMPGTHLNPSQSDLLKPFSVHCTVL